jgi:acyl-CoA synthetase (AMP-forming)/AMP-acid ligase II/acyl carrier protein
MSDTHSPTVQEIQQWLARNIADKLEMKPEDIRIDEPVTSLGLSSREAILLSGELEEWLGCELSPEILYEYPEIEALSQRLWDILHPAHPTFPDEMGYPSFTDLVMERAATMPDKDIFVFLADGENPSDRITMGALDLRARAIGAHLQAVGAAGHPVLLVYPPGIDFITGFLGCLYAGAIAVPAYPPTKTRGMERLEAIARDCNAGWALSNSEGAEDIRRNKKVAPDAFIRQLTLIATDTIPDTASEQWVKPSIGQGDLCFLQYTSGSTGHPKGVMVSHGNILHNAKAMREGFNLPTHLHMVSWLPMFHDMGLIGHVITPINMGCTQLTMPPNVFLEKPVRWLKAISQLDQVYTTAPNFAFDYCTDRIDHADLQDIDLSRWKLVCNGSEPVREQSMERFTKRFTPFGFRQSVFFPSYGMAEATLLISVRDARRSAPTILHLDPAALQENRALPTSGGTPVVGCGIARHGQLAIVHPETGNRLADLEVGEIWYKSPSIAQGYYGKPELTAMTFKAFTANTSEGPFLRTGDLGFMLDGELFITGRLKDLLIIRGRNHYPQDIEETLQQSHPALANNAGAAFTIDAGGAEQLVVVQELERTALRGLEPEPVFEAIRAAIAEEHAIATHAIVLLPPGKLPRTTSGKIQRRAAKGAFLSRSLEAAAAWEHAIEEGPVAAAVDVHMLLNLPLGARTEAVRQYLLSITGQALRTAPEQLPTHKPITNLGLDSIHAIDIKNRIEADLGVELPATRLIEGVSIDELALEAAAALRAPVAQQPAPENPGALDADAARDLLLDVDNLSPEDIDRLLAELGDPS